MHRQSPFRALQGAILGLLLSLSPVHLAAQQTGVIQGRVTDNTGAALEGSEVLVVGTGIGTLTDASGNYRLTNVPVGTHTVRARMIGYGAQEHQVRVTAGTVVTRNFTLSQEAVELRGITAVVGSRAAHTAAEELPVPVDIYTIDQITVMGTPEPAQILQELTPSANFPRQTVADGSDAVRPFTLRGLSPDHTLVLVNGKRRHPTALVHVLGSGIQGGSSGVDLNALPSNAIQRIEVLRDGAAAQYGSDAIAGVVNMALKEGPIPGRISAEMGGYVPNEYDPDGLLYTLTGEYGLPIGENGFLAVFGEYRFRNPTNRAGPDPRDQINEGDADVIRDGKVIEKNNPVPQPNHHWGDGKQRDVLAWWNGQLPLGDSDASFYTFGGYSYRTALNQGFYRRAMDGRNWPEIYPNGFLPNFDTPVTDLSAAAGVEGTAAGWDYDLSASFGSNDYEFNITNSLNTSLGPTSPTEFFAGALRLRQYIAGLDLTRAVEVGLASPLNVALGAVVRRERYILDPGEQNSYIDGGELNQHGEDAPSGSQVFPGFRPPNAADRSRNNIGAYADLETSLTPEFLVNVAGRVETYSDFGATVGGKVALRYQPTERWTFRGAASTGFRAPSLSQQLYAKTNTIFSTDPNTGLTAPFEVGLFRVDSEVARALGAKDLKEESSINFSGGFAVSPLNNFTITADYFFIRIEDRIVLSGQLYGEQVEELVAPFGAQRAQFFSNAIDTHTQGLDITANYRKPLGNGVLRVTGAFNYTQTRVVGEIDNPPELEGLEEQIFGFEARTAMEGEYPRTVAKLGAHYTTGNLTGSLRLTRYGEVVDSDSDPEQVQTLSPKILTDAEFGYQATDNLRLTVGARNIFDVFPDPTIEENNFLGIFPWPRSSPFGFNGRYLYVGTEVTGL